MLHLYRPLRTSPFHHFRRDSQKGQTTTWKMQSQAGSCSSRPLTEVCASRAHWVFSQEQWNDTCRSACHCSCPERRCDPDVGTDQGVPLLGQQLHSAPCQAPWEWSRKSPGGKRDRLSPILQVCSTTSTSRSLGGSKLAGKRAVRVPPHKGCKQNRREKLCRNNHDSASSIVISRVTRDKGLALRRPRVRISRCVRYSECEVQFRFAVCDFVSAGFIINVSDHHVYRIRKMHKSRRPSAREEGSKTTGHGYCKEESEI
jgi:hypothetical protein